MHFVPSHEKCFFHFRSTETEFFCEVAIETRNQKLGTTPHINNRPPEIHISALVSLQNNATSYPWVHSEQNNAHLCLLHLLSMPQDKIVLTTNIHDYLLQQNTLYVKWQLHAEIVVFSFA
jgi:hypothetical protein